MKAIIHQILPFLFLIIFPVKIQAKNHCPVSSCSSTFSRVRYPFKLKTDFPPKNCQDYINLSCNNQGQALINIPASGDFIVQDINYYTQRIVLLDPRNCLPGRMMTNFSFYPLRVFHYENYTYFTCPRKRIMHQFTAIDCLSNSENATIAVTEDLASIVEKFYDCEMIVRSLIPVRDAPVKVFYELELSWVVSGCKECEGDDDTRAKSGDSKSKWTKFFIPSAAVLATFFLIACLVRLMNLMALRGAINDTISSNTPTSATTASSTTVALPQTTGDPPPEAATLTLDGIENISKIKNYTELLGTSNDDVISGGTCSICLEEYHGKVRVRYLSQCGHYFHVECIDQWLLKNTTCPICRISL